MLLVPKDGKISWLTNLLNMIVSDVIPEKRPFRGCTSLSIYHVSFHTLCLFTYLMLMCPYVSCLYLYLMCLSMPHFSFYIQFLSIHA